MNTAETVIENIELTGIITYVHQASGKTIKDRMEKGYNLITIGNDLIYLKQGVLNQRKELGLD